MAIFDLKFGLLAKNGVGRCAPGLKRRLGVVFCGGDVFFFFFADTGSSPMGSPPQAKTNIIFKKICLNLLLCNLDLGGVPFGISELWFPSRGLWAWSLEAGLQGRESPWNPRTAPKESQGGPLGPPLGPPHQRDQGPTCMECCLDE